VLAESDLCAVEAFRWGRHAYGVQFHAEITARTPAEWWSLPDCQRSLEAALGPGAGARLAAETRDRLGAYGAMAEQMNAAFLNLVESSLALAGQG
jgi:GMP synthase-like glutamine amidotransferase